MALHAIKVGIIGPKVYSLDGHDYNNIVRTNLRKQFCSILCRFIEDEYVITGLTGLGLGCEQDFALACIERNIDYKVYLAYENMEKCWSKFPDHIHEKYNYLLSQSNDIIKVSGGDYSPKKILEKNKMIASLSDYIIYVNNKLKYGTGDQALELATELEKRIIFINV